MRKILAVLILATLSFAGCAGNIGLFTSPQAAVFAAKGGYEIALTATVAYRNLPGCSATVKLPCSDPAIVAQLQRAQPAVRASLDAAEEATRNPKFGGDVANTAAVSAQAALKAFTAIVATLPK